MEEFKLLNKSKNLLRYFNENILIDIPKVYSNYRKGIEDNLVNINYYIIKANINNGNIRNKYQKDVLVCISMVDMYLNILLDVILLYFFMIIKIYVFIIDMINIELLKINIMIILFLLNIEIGIIHMMMIYYM